jgi:hypothetical protein
MNRVVIPSLLVRGLKAIRSARLDEINKAHMRLHLCTAIAHWLLVSMGESNEDVDFKDLDRHLQNVKDELESTIRWGIR